MTEKQQAFPAAWGNHEQGGDYIPGMTLRDYFAGQALAGLCANHQRLSEINRLYENDDVTIAEAVATECYVMAAAMLSAREGESHE